MSCFGKKQSSVGVKILFPKYVLLTHILAITCAQSCKKITILDRKDQDLFIGLDLSHDLDQFIDLLKLILIFDL